ncbi:hypothetical protein [Halorhabdus amylolytica]|uniref:hypothetical protein n=1 Tax=Halorhabdus amylolytica TaxID=2559573 RepID=UPI0010AAD49D|nr:hypothetical protein [Halorhabdus amylolytica]
MDRSRLETRLVERFDADPAVAHVVARAAGDLVDSGSYPTDVDASLTVEVVIANLADAPDGTDLAGRWNWWMGALELSHGGYDRFCVRPDAV